MASSEGAETRQGNGLPFLVNDVTDVLSEGAPKPVERHESILLVSGWVGGSCFLDVGAMIADLPNVVPQL